MYVYIYIYVLCMFMYHMYISTNTVYIYIYDIHGLYTYAQIWSRPPQNPRGINAMHLWTTEKHSDQFKTLSSVHYIWYPYIQYLQYIHIYIWVCLKMRSAAREVWLGGKIRGYDSGYGSGYGSGVWFAALYVPILSPKIPKTSECC